MYLRPMSGITAQLRWDDSWGGADKDLDIFLIPETSSILSLSDSVASSTDSQTGATDNVPYERISLGYGEIEGGEYCIAVRKTSGSAPSWIQLLVWGNHGDLQNYVSARSIANPAESSNTGMLAVGAAPYFSTSFIERFSSQGPTTDDRTKPDVVGADRSNSKIWGQWGGTSQSSPHVAGLAALVKQRFPSYTPAQIASYIKTNALARGDKPNNTSGTRLRKNCRRLVLPLVLPLPVSTLYRCEDLRSSNRNLSGCDLANADLDGKAWTLVDFSGANLTGADLSGSSFTKTNFNADLWFQLHKANLGRRTQTSAVPVTSKTDFTDANLIGADIGGSSSLSLAIWSNTVCPDGSNSDDADNDSCYPDHLTRATVTATPTPTTTPVPATPTPTATATPTPTPQPARCLKISSGADLSGCDLSSARIHYINLRGANLTGANLTRASLHGNSFSEATLTNADLTGAFLHRNDFSGATLTNADLTGADLHRNNFSSSPLGDPDIRIGTGADPNGNDLSGANLTGADLTSADLRNDFSGATLTNADLTGAEFMNNNLSGANLTGADFTAVFFGHERQYMERHNLSGRYKQ